MHRIILLHMDVFGVAGYAQRALGRHNSAIIAFATRASQPFCNETDAGIIFPLFIRFHRMTNRSRKDPKTVYTTCCDGIL